MPLSIHSTFGKVIFIYLLPLFLGLLGLLFLIQYLGITPVYQALIPKTLFLLCVLMAVYLLFYKTHYDLLVSVLSVAFIIAVSWVTYNTVGTLGGLSDDNYISISMFTTFIHTWRNEDFTFAGLSSFYPYYFHYFFAKLGALFSLSAQNIFKYSAIISFYLMLVLSFLLWKQLSKPSEAFVYFLAGIAILTVAKIFRKPYEFLIMFIIIPWWIIYIASHKDKMKDAILGGALGGVFFGVYYYWFFPLTIASIYIFFEKWKNQQFSFDVIKYYSVLIIVFLIFASPYLLPYIYDLLMVGAEPQQNRWFHVSHLDWLPLQGINSFQDLSFYIGLAYLIYNREQFIAKHLLIILAASYLWVLLGHFAIINNTPVLYIKLLMFIQILLTLGFFGGILHTVYQLKIKKNVIIFILLIYSVAPLFKDISHQHDSRIKQLALNSKPAQITQNPHLLSLIEGKILLAARSKIFTLNPFVYVHFFTEMHSHYAHPAALTTQRLAFLNQLSQSDNYAFVIWMLKNNRFSAIDYIWLDQYTLHITHDNFPNDLKELYIHFKPELFKQLNAVNEFQDLYKVPEIISPPNISSLNATDKAIYNEFKHDSENI